MFLRKDRQQTANLIEAYLKGELDKSHVENWKHLSKSPDVTVRYACDIVSKTYDDLEDDICHIEKHEWDHLERIRLVLLSRAQLQRHFEFPLKSQLYFARAGLTIFLVGLAVLGWDWPVLFVTSFLGVLIFLHFRREPCTNRKGSPFTELIEPFDSIQQLESVYCASVEFRKNRFPREWREPNQDWHGFAWLINGFWCTVVAVILSILSPAILLVLSLPTRRTVYSVVA